MSFAPQLVQYFAVSGILYPHWEQYIGCPPASVFSDYTIKRRGEKRDSEKLRKAPRKFFPEVSEMHCFSLVPRGRMWYS
jgi:hypothetical protein